MVRLFKGDHKKFKVYVKNPKGNVVKVNFGQGGDSKGGTMRIRKSNPKAVFQFWKPRHNCDNPGQDIKRYWSCQVVNHLRENNLGYWEHWWSIMKISDYYLYIFYLMF